MKSSGLTQRWDDGHDVPCSSVGWDTALPGRGEHPGQQPWQRACPEPRTLALLRSIHAGVPQQHPHVSWEGTLSSAPTLSPRGFSQAAPLYCTKFLLAIPQQHDP